MRGFAAQLQIELILALRRGESLLITLVVPVVLLVFFGALAITPTDFLVPGLLALAVMSTSMVSLGIQTAYERYYGALKRLLGSPLPLVGLLSAKSLAVLLFEVVQIVLLVAIARVGLWLVARWIAAAGRPGAGRRQSGLCRPGAAHGRHPARRGHAGDRQRPVSRLFAVGRLRPAARAIATRRRRGCRLLPAAALSDATRAALNGSGSVQDVLGPLALLAAWAVVAIGAAVLTFKSD